MQPQVSKPTDRERVRQYKAMQDILVGVLKANFLGAEEERVLVAISDDLRYLIDKIERNKEEGLVGQ